MASRKERFPEDARAAELFDAAVAEFSLAVDPDRREAALAHVRRNLELVRAIFEEPDLSEYEQEPAFEP